MEAQLNTLGTQPSVAVTSARLEAQAGLPLLDKQALHPSSETDTAGEIERERERWRESEEGRLAPPALLWRASHHRETLEHIDAMLTCAKEKRERETVGLCRRAACRGVEG